MLVENQFARSSRGTVGFILVREPPVVSPVAVGAQAY